MAPIGVSVLGATGSVGQQTLDVVRCLSDRFRIVALTAGANARLLADQIREFDPEIAVCDVIDENLRAAAGRPELLSGTDGLIAAATHPGAQIVVVATAGHAAIVPTIAALEAGKIVAIANKEVLVCAGELIMPIAAKSGNALRPIDSEHSAIWQALGHVPRADVAKLILTASGGPFRSTPLRRLSQVTVADALKHPTWQMGSKVTIDSATMMNKGLELIEARWLFEMPYEKIEVLVHPESIIHSLVEYLDGSQVAQLSWPDMRLPIQYALSYPDHIYGPCRSLDLASVGSLTFERLDVARFPAVRLAREAGKAGRSFPTVLSTADTVAVNAFAEGKIAFPQIVEVVAATLDAHEPHDITSVADVVDAESWSRSAAQTMVDRATSRARG